MSDLLSQRAEFVDNGWRAILAPDTAILVELAGEEVVRVGLQLVVCVKQSDAYSGSGERV
jgi:hypothetical protein